MISAEVFFLGTRAPELDGFMTALTSTPASNNRFTTSMCPSRTANIIAVNPSLLVLLKSAPPSINASMDDTFPSAAAHIKGVCLCRSPSLTFASFANKCWIDLAFPLRAANINGVTPPGCSRFASAPALSNVLTILSCPNVQAIDSGVTSYRVFASTAHFAATNFSTVAM